MYPDFLLIGAQRAGTSWLSMCLRQHPRVVLPPLKELHYFDRDIVGSIFWTDIFTPRRRALCVRCKRALLNMLRNRTHGLSWLFHYFFGKRSDQWYSGLFPPTGGVIQGDCTPAYSTLDEKTVEHVAKIMPKAKIIFILRDPVDRSWSHAKLDLGRRGGRALDSIADEEYIAHTRQEASQFRSDYGRTIDVWGRAFPQEQMKIVFFDDLKQRPEEFIREICAFLDIDSLAMEPRNEQKRAVNETGRYSMPSAVRTHLCRQYLDQLGDLSDRFGGHATEWLRQAEAFLGGADRLG